MTSTMMKEPPDDPQEDVAPILVVDDHQENLLAMRGVLERPGYEVRTAGSGNEALKEVLKQDFAVILLDVLMPYMDGFETARLIRGRGASRHTPIIFLTAAGADVSMIERAYAVGGVDYLVKPVNAGMVRAKVGVFVDLFRKARQMRRREEQLRAAERDRSEAAIREGEALYEASFNTAAVGIAHVTGDGRWLRANPRFGHIIGYEPAELLKLHMEEVIHPADLAEDRAGLRRLFDGELEAYHREERFLHKNGHVVWMDVTASPLRDASSKVKNLIYLVEDITSRRDAKKRERLLAGVSELLLQSLDHPADMASVAGLIAGSLGEWCVIGTVEGRPEVDRPIGKSVVAHADSRRAPSADRLRAALEASAEYAASLASDATMTSVAPSADLSVAWNIDEALIKDLDVNVALSLPFSTHDRVLGRVTFLSKEALGPGEVLTAHDVTQRIALALDNARLHREAEDAVRARDEFLSIASHELRTPLTPLRIHFQRMLDERGRIVAGGAERMQPILQRCERQVRRLEALIENLFDVSRITTGKMSLQLAEVDLGEVVRDVVTRFAEDLAASGCEVSLDIAGDALVGCWDRLRMEQVVTNIVGNAIKYAPGSPIDITVSSGSTSEGHTARLSVRDHGAGIPAGDLERIFQRFHRVGSMPTSTSGLGLGLYIVKQIVEAHAGSISVESSPEQGTRFVVEVPFRANGPTTPNPPTESAPITFAAGSAHASALVGFNDRGVWS